MGDVNMNINLIKTSDAAGAIFIKHQRSPMAPEVEITLPFYKNDEGYVNFTITEEALFNLVNLCKTL